MDKRIIYKTADGIGVLIPTPYEFCGLTIEMIAAKDVPAGLPYKIVDASEVPSDRSQRELWDVDEADLTDGTGADYGVGSQNVLIGWDADGNPVIDDGTPFTEDGEPQ